MYYTNYFKGIDISSLTSVCETCINSLRTAGNTTISFNGILESNMSDKLETALADNKSEIESLINEILTGLRTRRFDPQHLSSIILILRGIKGMMRPVIK